jgi:hypothetical protein
MTDQGNAAVARRPTESAQSTIDAYRYLKRDHPERLPAWLARHPDFNVAEAKDAA